MRRFRVGPDSIERKLRHERPQPTDDLIQRISASIGSPAPRTRWNFAVAFAVTVAIFTAFALTGGVSYASFRRAKGSQGCFARGVQPAAPSQRQPPSRGTATAGHEKQVTASLTRTASLMRAARKERGGAGQAGGNDEHGNDNDNGRATATTERRRRRQDDDDEAGRRPVPARRS